MHMLKSHVSLYLEIRILWNWLSEVTRVGPNATARILNKKRRRHQSSLFSLYACVPWKSLVRTQQEICKPGREDSLRNWIIWHCDPGLSSISELWEINFRCLSHLVYGISLRQPKQVPIGTNFFTALAYIKDNMCHSVHEYGAKSCSISSPTFVPTSEKDVVLG